jgi:Spy/CpxP family protein refolding chaperone
MKRLMMGAFFCLCVVGAMAQIRRTVAPKPKADSVAVVPDRVAEGEGRKGKIKALDLNKQQKSKLKGAMQSAKQEKEAIENDDKLSDAEKKQKLQELRKRQMAHLDSVLTPEQKQQMLKMRRESVQQKRSAKKKPTNEPIMESEMKQEQ